MRALDVQGLSVRYLTGDYSAGTPEILHGLSFYVEKGEVVGIVGESGSGKSTAMLAVMGLLGDKASVKSDSILVSGSPSAPGKNIAMIFQDSLSCLNPSVRIGQQMTETIRMRKKCTRKEAQIRAEELLNRVGIRNVKLRMRQYPFELSGGMRQRVVIAIALACEPDVIIADEPTTSLDAAVQAQILLLLKSIVRETGTSLLLVSHDMGVTAAMCSRIYVMHRGKIVENGTAEDIFYDPQEEYTRQLLRDAKGSIENRDRHGGKKTSGEEDRIPLVSVSHVTKAFDSREGVRDVSVDLYGGEVFALVGESGSGKTTLARILSGILKADEGELHYQGKLLDERLRKTECEGKIQMVFQDPYASLNPCLTVRQTLREALLPHLRRKYGVRKPDEEKIELKIREMLELTGLKEGDLNRYPDAFSGGQRQRIGIARALIVGPELLICDEALSSLDATTQEQILKLLLEIQRERGISCLFISHDIHVVRRISTKVAVMYRGQIVETGRTKEVCSDPWHPYTKQLIEAVPEPDPLRAVKIKAAPLLENSTDIQTEHAGCLFAPQCGYALECCRHEVPEAYRFGSRETACFLYSEKHSGRRTEGYKMTSQI